MKEARLIIPRVGSILPCIHLEEVIYSNFGGYTQTAGTGVWQSPALVKIEEDITIIDVAYEQNTANDLILFTAAKTFLKEANQIEVYLRYGNGTVQFIQANSVMDNGRPNEAYHPDFAGIVDAVNQLIDGEQTPGTRVAAFEFIHHSLDLGNKGRHRLNAPERATMMANTAGKLGGKAA